MPTDSQSPNPASFPNSGMTGERRGNVIRRRFDEAKDAYIESAMGKQESWAKKVGNKTSGVMLDDIERLVDALGLKLVDKGKVCVDRAVHEAYKDDRFCPLRAGARMGGPREMKTKKCPNEACGKDVGWTARKCDCGQVFGKAAKAASHPTKTRRPKKRRAKTAKLPVKTRPAAKVEVDQFRVGIFLDGGMVIVNERGGLELDADQAIKVAQFCREQFQVAEE
jgi:hypothetical protein